MGVTKKGKKQILELLQGQVSHFGLGINPSSESEFAENLGDEKFRRVITDNAIDEETLSMDVECFLGSGEANGHDFSEIGLFDSASGGNMFVISNFPPEEKTPLLEWLIDVVIEIK